MAEQCRDACRSARPSSTCVSSFLSSSAHALPVCRSRVIDARWRFQQHRPADAGGLVAVWIAFTVVDRWPPSRQPLDTPSSSSPRAGHDAADSVGHASPLPIRLAQRSTIFRSRDAAAAPAAGPLTTCTRPHPWHPPAPLPPRCRPPPPPSPALGSARAPTRRRRRLRPPAPHHTALSH